MSGLWVRGVVLFLSLINKSCRGKSFSWRQTVNVQRRTLSHERVCLAAARRTETRRTGRLKSCPVENWRKRLSEFSKPWANRSVHQANWVLWLLKIRTKAAGTSLGAHMSQDTVKAGQGCSSPTQVSFASSSYRAQKTKKLHMEKTCAGCYMAK